MENPNPQNPIPVATNQPQQAPQSIDPNEISAEQKAADLAALVKSKEERQDSPGAATPEGQQPQEDMPNPFRK